MVNKSKECCSSTFRTGTECYSQAIATCWSIGRHILMGDRSRRDTRSSILGRRWARPTTVAKIQKFMVFMTYLQHLAKTYLRFCVAGLLHWCSHPWPCPLRESSRALATGLHCSSLQVVCPKVQHPWRHPSPCPQGMASSYSHLALWARCRTLDRAYN